MNRDEFFKELEKTKTDKLREIASKNGNLSMFDNSMDEHVENIEWLYGIKEDNSEYSGWTVIFDEAGEFIKVEFGDLGKYGSGLTEEEIESLKDLEEFFNEFADIDDHDSDLDEGIEEIFIKMTEDADYDNGFDDEDEYDDYNSYFDEDDHYDKDYYDGDKHDNSGSNEISLSMKLINDKPVMLSQLGNPEEVLRLMVEFTRCITGVQPKMKKIYLRAFKELIEELNEEHQ